MSEPLHAGMRTIAGHVRYDLLAQKHRPSDPASLAAAVRAMDAQGLTPADIAGQLRVPVVRVRALLTRRAIAAAEVFPVQLADAITVHESDDSHEGI